MRVGVIGLGNIGGAIATNLITDGHDVSVFDVDSARQERIALHGAQARHSAVDVGRNAEVTFLSLPNPAVMEQVTAAWLSGAARDSVLVDLSTNAPATVRKVGAQLEAKGCQLLEAPLTGGAPGAQARMLVFMVGGDEKIYERCRPLLDKLGRASFHVGPLGAGNTAKLVNSLLAFTSTWASLEGLAIAVKSGIDLRTMIDVIRTGGAGNFFTDRMVEGINERGRPTMFSLALAAKDAGLLLDVAQQAGVPVRVANEIAGSLEAAVKAGLGERDFTDLVELMEKQADVKFHLRPAEKK